jgi:hypothetical protein
MAILQNQTLTINGDIIAYEGNVKFTKGSKTRKANPQISGQNVFTSDNSTNYSVLKVSVRNTSENNALFDKYYNNGDNNVISYGEDSITGVTLEVIPEREDQGLTEYTFYGNAVI